MSLDERVLVRAPTSRDGELARGILAQAGLEACVCRSLRELALEAERGAGALLLTEDADGDDSMSPLFAVFARQPQWSELPVVVLAHPTRASPVVQRLAALPGLTLLERPVRARTLVSALQSALRARRRQYQIKAQLEAMHDLQARLAEELSGMHRLHRVGARLLLSGPLEPLLRDVLHAALDLTGADLGTIELAGDDGVSASVAVQMGFSRTPNGGDAAPAGGPGPAGFEREYASMPAPSIGAGVLGLRATLRIATGEGPRPGASAPVPDATLATLRAAGIDALQCAPLLGAAGRPLGAISVYWRGRPRDSETRRLLFDLLVRQAAALLERGLAEQERRSADRRKDEFLATLAHELRNPLAPIRQAARVARSSGVSDEQLRWSTGIIERQVSHMALLLDDLLDVSRITRGILVLRRERVSLAAVIAAAVETSRPAIDARAHTLEVDPPAKPIWVDADPLRLGQVLGNLLNNAAKYTDRGGRLRLWTSQSSPDAIAIHVRDSGIGLDPASLTRVFEMFSQVTSSIERSEGGLGIGLALVRGLVEMHGGRVEARSDGPGRGSEFVVQLPLPTTVPDVAEAPLRAPTAPPASRRILVADDNVDAAESLALLLRLEGHAVEVVHDGAQAVAAVARERPDVALLDIGMPRLNGYEAAQRLRALATADDAPMLLVAVTGWGQRDDRRRASAAGFDHHLTKPVDFERLRELVLARPAEVAAQSSGEVGFNGSRSRMEEWSGVPLPAAKLSDAPTWSAR